MKKPNLPFKGRALTQLELDNCDVKRFLLPGSEETIEIVGPLRLALWLLTAFDNQCTSCVVRPRKLELHHDVTVELDFWALYGDGSERFIHLISDKDCLSGPTGRAFRDATLWSSAAQRTGTPLTFVFERDIASKGQRVANFLRMLANVQASYHLPDRLLLRERVKEFFDARPTPMTIEQVKGGLFDLNSADVHAALCGFIYEGAIAFDVDLPLGERTVLTWTGVLKLERAA